MLLLFSEINILCIVDVSLVVNSSSCTLAAGFKHVYVAEPTVCTNMVKNRNCYVLSAVSTSMVQSLQRSTQIWTALILSFFR